MAYYPFRTRDGEVTALTMTLHPISRFLIEIIRVDEQPVFSTPWSISQNISVLILAAAVCLWIYVLRQPARRRLARGPKPPSPKPQPAACAPKWRSSGAGSPAHEPHYAALSERRHGRIEPIACSHRVSANAVADRT